MMTTTIVIPEEVTNAIATAETEKLQAETEKLRNKWYETIKKAVAFKQAVVVPLEGLDEETAKQLNTKDIKVIPVKTNSDRFTGHFAIFNGAEIDGRESLDQITMEVPKGMERVVAGANKWQVSEMVNTSWLRRRHVSWINIKGV